MTVDRYLSISALCVTGLFSGCAAGPDFERPAAPAVGDYTREPFSEKTVSADVTAGEEQKFVRDQAISAQWWTLFRSPQLSALIEKALKNNPSVQGAQAALRQAQELVYAQQGYYYPTVQGNLSSSRQRTSATVSPTLNSNERLFNLHTA
ncbi:MAG TPA: TolC family protein, partial [Steroidobacteraceae bacterium]|nr:TolC family protein [Steroidobacteraceae bacterium]